MVKDLINEAFITTAGSTYLDIDAYACCVAMAELLRLKGENAVAYSKAPCNYSVCKTLIEEGQILNVLPAGWDEEKAKYIIVDVSDPEFLKKSVPLNQVIELYDHHAGFEEYWKNRIGDKSHIEFIGAAATLIYREWKKCGLQNKMKRSTALLLIAAILDNTLNLTSTNTTDEDVKVFHELCQKEKIDEKWCATYFSEVQTSVEDDLKNAIFSDIKTVINNPILPSQIAQICVWEGDRILARLSEIRQWFGNSNCWMINVIDIKQQCSYFVCDSDDHQKKLETVFDIRFEEGVAKTKVSYLRKEIIKNTLK